MPQFDYTICSHVWNYSRLATYQLSSLIIWPPQCTVKMVVCYTKEDRKTVRMIDFFANCGQWPNGVEFAPMSMETEQLLRRPIGRNIVATTSDSRIVWFADADYLFGEGLLDAILAVFPPDAKMVFPRHCIRTTMEGGDKLISRVTEPAILHAPLSMFIESRRERRALGGTHIVRGDIAKQDGYLPDRRRYQSPAKHWHKTAEDPAYRKRTCGGRGTALDVPNCLRIRHSKFGREHIGCEN